MPKHGGCYICGSTQDDYLISAPDMSTMESVALCSQCRGLSNEALRHKIDAVRAAVKKAREEASHA